MSQLCIHTQLKVIFAHLSTFKYWKKVNTMYQYMYLNPNTTLIKTPHPRWGSSKRYPLHQVQQLYRKPYNSLYLYWNELNDWTLVWINQIWWFHSSMTCRQVLWSASYSRKILNVWDSQRDTSIIDFSEWWGMDWLGPRCFGGDPYE